MTTYPIHDAANIFPPLEASELQELATSIREHGLKESVKLYQGAIIDGRNRLAACRIAGVEPLFEQASVNGSPADYVYAMNFHRRHLTAGGRALAAARYKEVAAKEAKDRQKQAGGDKKSPKRSVVATAPQAIAPKARDVAGAKYNVSGKTVDAAAMVTKQASPELVKAVERGTIAVATAARLSKAPKAVQTAAVASGKRAVRKAITDYAPTIKEDAENSPGVLWHKSMRKVLQVVISTRDAGGIEMLTKKWTPEIRKMYHDDVVELIRELQTWKTALASK